MSWHLNYEGHALTGYLCVTPFVGQQFAFYTFVGSTACFYFSTSICSNQRQDLWKKRCFSSWTCRVYIGMLFPIAQVYLCAQLNVLFPTQTLCFCRLCLSLNFPRGQPSARVYHKLCKSTWKTWHLESSISNLSIKRPENQCGGGAGVNEVQAPRPH